MQALGRKRPEIPHRRRRTQIGLRVTLLGVDKVRELQRIAHEEHGSVVANQVPIAFFGIELDGKAAHVALGVRRAHLTGNGGETQDQRRFRTRLQRLGARVFGNVAGDLERSVSAPALGVHDALGDAFAVLVGQLLDELVVLHQHRTARACRNRILVIRNGGASAGCHCRFVGHEAS